MIRHERPTEARGVTYRGVINWVAVALLGLGALLAPSCDIASEEPPADSVALGLECRGDEPLEKAAYYAAPNLTWYQAAQICLDCPDWPFRDDWEECAARALAKFR